jgi:hypothetical protein
LCENNPPIDAKIQPPKEVKLPYCKRQEKIFHYVARELSNVWLLESQEALHRDLALCFTSSQK